MFILRFSSTSVTLENSGGKGSSLARLTRLGLPVPPGFIVTTEAYVAFVRANRLDSVIVANLAGLNADETSQLENVSSHIREAFSVGGLPEEILNEVAAEYRRLDPQSTGVAVRSSATTEDLPELSFAGQQETYLNVVGESQLQKAVIDCWSSLWTARAIGYRARNAIPHDQAALAVVVQQMVKSEVSGVMFTANPLTGLLSETVIDATFGLGEALVSGKVEPDHYVVDPISGDVTSITLGTKGLSTRARTGGGVENQPEQAARNQVLNPDQIRELAVAGQQIQAAYGTPQDIEWTFSGGSLSILQSRPITALFPIPRTSFDPLIVWFSFGAFQGVLSPMTPLGQESIQRVAVGVGKKLGLATRYESQETFAVAGERIWVKISDMIRNPMGNRLLGGFLGIGEPGTAMILQELLQDPRLHAGKGRLRFSTLRRLLGFLRPVLGEMPRSILRPEEARDRFDADLEAYLETVSIPGGENRFEQLANFAAFMEDQGGLADALPVLLPRFAPIMAPSLAALTLIDHLLPREKTDFNGISMSAMDVTRGMPRNITTQMDLALWEVARTIQGDPALASLISGTDPQELAGMYLQAKLPTPIQTAIRQFLDHYGMRGTGEIDLGQPRWREDPAPVFQTLQSYLKIAPEAAPDLLFQKNAQAAEQAIERMAAEVRRLHGGRIKEKLLRGAARRVRLLLGARESPKFYAVRAMGIMRETLLQIGEQFQSAGTIERRGDLFFLHVSELTAMAHHEERDWKAIIAGRRQVYEREQRRRHVPRVLVSDGRTFYEGSPAEAESGDILSGSPVSPGVIEGNVHIVLDPRGANLAPGEIMVCPATDPAWTPLFMAAAGLIMEVGGMMTHGSVVAREYGIPAVVGVRQATTRLKDGQHIRLDGSRGRITLLK